jgi:hypothetical protein
MQKLLLYLFIYLIQKQNEKISNAFRRHHDCGGGYKQGLGANFGNSICNRSWSKTGYSDDAYTNFTLTFWYY